jgi:Golgi SNAP receptor complex protein 2
MYFEFQNAHRGIDDMLSQGSNILNNLRDQGAVLKRTKKRILDFTNSLGLSNTVMQLIERRAYQDKYILYGGMLLTLTIIFFIYLYFV